jgi:hypothetical protein
VVPARWAPCTSWWMSIVVPVTSGLLGQPLAICKRHRRRNQ